MSSDFSTRHVTKSSLSNFPRGIVLICILFLSFILWSKWDKISTFFGDSLGIPYSLEDSGFVEGEPVTLEGVIRPDGDFITHTHTLLTQSSGVFGLKSKTINLNLYTGNISLDGTVAARHSGLVIIEITSVLDLNPILTGDVLSGSISTGDSITGDVLTGVSLTGVVVSSGPTLESGALSTTKTVLTVDQSVQQFPVTIGTGISFVSSRGHSILFPSKKISFQSTNLSPIDFGVKGLRCYAQMNVVDYANKLNIATAPSVKIFECTNKTDTIPSQFASISLDDGRVFLIEATDPAWVNFVNAIEITPVTTTN